MNALLWLTVLATKLTDWIRVKIDQRRNYRNFRKWMDSWEEPLARVKELERIEELERRHPAIRGR